MDINIGTVLYSLIPRIVVLTSLASPIHKKKQVEQLKNVVQSLSHSSTSIETQWLGEGSKTSVTVSAVFSEVLILYLYKDRVGPPIGGRRPHPPK